MGCPRAPETSDSERKKYFDSNPTRYYRPPLRSDPRSLVQKVSHLSLLEKPQHGTTLSESPADDNLLEDNGPSSKQILSSITSSSNRNSTRSVQSRLFQKRSSALDFPRKHAFRVIDSNGVVGSHDATLDLTANISKEAPPLLSSQSQSYPIVHDLQSNSSIEDVKSTACNSNLKAETLHLHPTSKVSSSREQFRQNGTLYGKPTSHSQAKKKESNGTALPVHSQLSSKEDLKPSQNWRLKAHVFKPHDSDSGVDSPKEPSSPKCSTPVPLADLPSSRSPVRSIIFPTGLNQSLSSCQSIDTQSCEDLHLESDMSLNQSFVSADDDVLCLTPDDPVPEPIPLLPVPDHLRRYTPLCNMDRTSSRVESSSGASSLSTSLNLDLSICTESSSVSPTPKEGCELQTSNVGNVDYSGSRAQLSKGDSAFESSSDNLNETHGSSPCHRKVVASFRASFSATSIEKPDRSFSSSQCSDTSASTMASMGLPASFGTTNVLKRKAVDTPKTEQDINETLRVCFSKRFSFKPLEWKLPDSADAFSSEPWELNKFLSLKHSLNAVKDELNDLTLQDWHAHTRRRNKAGNVIWQLRKKIDPEFPTQAWCKFYENASSFPLVPEKAINMKRLNSVHLCEAPGAFITSLNHFLHVNYGEDFKFDWRAVTLNPYYEGNPLSCMINDDRLILQTLDKWLFGQDNTGDLMKRENLVKIMDGSSQLGQVLLVTADGSIDCQDNPAEQEDIVSWLHFCETVAALQMLAPGGSFLIKMFTFFEHASICLMYLLNCVFKKVTVNKPVTSKEGNSEVYVVCCDYVGGSSIRQWLDVLMEHYGPTAPKNALFSLQSIPNSFLDQLYRCADFFRRLQSDVIRENIRSYHNPVQRDSYLTAAIRHRVADKFFALYRVQKLPRRLYLVNKADIKNVSTPNIDARVEEGSFNDRKKRLALSPEEELKYIKDDLLLMNVKWPGDFDVFWMDFPDNPEGFGIVKGKPITKVNSSKFCLGRLLKLRNRVREIAQDHFKVSVMQSSSESDTREFPWPDETDDSVKRKVTTLDFKNRLWASLEDGSNAVNEKNACREILSAIEHKVFRDDCLELRGYPLLTQFNVGLVFLLGHLFQKVGFVRPQGQDIRVLFYNYKKFNPEMQRHWDEVVSVMDHDSEVVLSVVQISELSDGDFYRYVTEINNLCVVEQIQDLLSAMTTKS